MIFPCQHPISDSMLHEFCIFRSPVQHDRFSVYALDHLGNKLFCYAINKSHEDCVIEMMEAYRLYSVVYEQQFIEDEHYPYGTHPEELLEDDDF